MSRFQNFAVDATNKQPRNCHIFMELAQFDNFITLSLGRKKIVYICVFSPLPAAGCGKGAAGGHGGQVVGAGVCVGGIGLLFDIFGAPPGDGATYTLPYTLSQTAAHCNTLQIVTRRRKNSACFCKPRFVRF